MEKEGGDSMFRPQKCAPTPTIPELSLKALFTSGNSAAAPNVPLMSIEFNMFHYIMEKPFQLGHQNLLDVLGGLSVGFCVCGCWFAWLNFVLLKLIWKFLSFFFYFFQILAKGWASEIDSSKKIGFSTEGEITGRNSFLPSLFSVIPLPAVAPPWIHTDHLSAEPYLSMDNQLPTVLNEVLH